MTNRLHIPKWVCAGAILLGAAALVVQGGIDIYQGTRDLQAWSSELFTQAWQMALPTGFTLVFAAFGGCLLQIRAWKSAGLLYALVFGYMAITITNSMDFMADNTLATREAAKQKVVQAKDIAAIRNDLALQERKEAVENGWRTYYAARNQADKAAALASIQAITKDGPSLVAPDIEPLKVGSGGIWSRWLGWRPEAVQEAKAVALPILIMIGKALGITLGFAFWPRGDGLPLPKREAQSKAMFGPNVAKFSRAEARSDIERLAHSGALNKMDITGADFARRWGVSKPTASTWLSDFRKEGIILRQRVGERNRLAVRAGTNGHANGSNGHAIAGSA